MQETYSVYEHIVPNGKRYFGITKQEPSRRWQNGFGYKGQFFYYAIQKYGWDKIKHNILKIGLSLEKANEYERYYIRKYKTDKPQYGYNCTVGGEGVISTYNDIVLQKKNGVIVNMFLNKNECASLLGLSTTTVKKYCEDNNLHGGYLFEIIYHYNTIDFYKKCEDFNEKYFDVKEKIEDEKKLLISNYMRHRQEKVISQYSLDGMLIHTYNSKKEAEKNLGIYIDMRYRRHKDFIFEYGNQKQVNKYCNRKNKKVYQKDKENENILNKYDSIMDASINTNINFKNISKALNGINKTAGGYIWEYAC